VITFTRIPALWHRVIASAASGRGGSNIVTSPRKQSSRSALFAGRRGPGGRGRPAGERQHPQAFLGAGLNLLGDLLPPGFRQGPLGTVAAKDAHAPRLDRLGGALGIQPPTVGFDV